MLIGTKLESESTAGRDGPYRVVGESGDHLEWAVDQHSVTEHQLVGAIECIRRDRLTVRDEETTAVLAGEAPLGFGHHTHSDVEPSVVAAALEERRHEAADAATDLEHAGSSQPLRSEPGEEQSGVGACLVIPRAAVVPSRMGRDEVVAVG